jgi:hypothetical protein
VSGRWLKWGGRLDRYVGALFVSSWATALLLLVGLFLILDLSSNLDEYLEAWPDGTRAPTFLIVRYYLLNVPFVFLQVGAFVTLVAGLFTVSKLLKHNETIAAAGRRRQRAPPAAPVFLGGALVGGADCSACASSWPRTWPTSATGLRFVAREEEVGPGSTRTLAARPEQQPGAPGRVPSGGVGDPPWPRCAAWRRS